MGKEFCMSFLWLGFVLDSEFRDGMEIGTRRIFRNVLISFFREKVSRVGILR